MSTPIKTRSQGPADPIDLDHPEAKATGSRSLNIEDELAFYGSYHSAVGNRIIHFICIPLIMWSTLVLVSHYYIPGSKLHVWPIGLAFQPSIASLIAIGYQLYYIRLEPIGGITFIPWSILIYGTAAYTYHFPPTWAPYSSALHPTATPLAWMVFAFSWIAQFIGHGVFEKRAPALKDNLVQALVTAPFFVHLEILFDGFNYRPELQKRIKNKVGIRIRDFRRASKKAE